MEEIGRIVEAGPRVTWYAINKFSVQIIEVC